MKTRTVKQLLFAEMVDMGGIPVRQPFPARNIEQIDPFLLLHHHISRIREGADERRTGVGPHPHRGFSPVTFIFQGNVHHRDSRGNDSIVEAGGVQWMDAGMGIQHSERPSKELAEKGGVQEIIQLWINTPAKDKMNAPKYQAVHASDMPVFPAQEGEGNSFLVSGEFRDTKGPVQSNWPVLAMRGEWKSGAVDTFSIPENYNAFLYLLDGKMNVDGFGLVEGLNVVQFQNDGDTITLKALEDTRFIFLAAPPIGEPLAMYGPFVMNDQTQVMQAIRDYQMGKMGVLIEDF
jgi:hypothetical protein